MRKHEKRFLVCIYTLHFGGLALEETCFGYVHGAGKKYLAMLSGG